MRTEVRLPITQTGKLRLEHGETWMEMLVEGRARGLVAALVLVTLGSSAPGQSNPAFDGNAIGTVAHLKDFQVIELRRYTIKEGEREHFAQYFDTYFPEALEQVGTLVLGAFFERKNSSGFTWIRGYHSMDDRAIANATFYFGPVWKEYKATMISLLQDSDNVLLLHPLTPERGVTVLPMVDPVTEASGAQGVIVAQIFAVKANGINVFARQAEAAFAAYRGAGVREAGLLASLDVPNTFPQLSFRTDGPFLVWLGIVEDDEALATRFHPAMEKGMPSLAATGLLRSDPETVILDPTRRSRLRWLSTAESQPSTANDGQGMKRW
ncbi:MAG TPA: NIPSNAP family protein [Terriglobales bacterium]|nr:NIPSNAP family protein [Terriglobales bacterium]